jgi:hypothetical protein
MLVFESEEEGGGWGRTTATEESPSLGRRTTVGALLVRLHLGVLALIMRDAEGLGSCRRCLLVFQSFHAPMHTETRQYERGREGGRERTLEQTSS